MIITSIAGVDLVPVKGIIMAELNQADNDLLKQIADLTRLHEQDSKIIEGYMEKITRLNNEIRCHEYIDMSLERARLEILSLKKELGK